MNPSGSEVTPDMFWEAPKNIATAGAPSSPDVSMKPSGNDVTLDMLRQAPLNIFAAGAPVNIGNGLSSINVTAVQFRNTSR